jgi:hypothetical protein
MVRKSALLAGLSIGSLSCGSEPASHSSEYRPLVLATSITVPSTTYGGDQRVSVRVPEGYDRGTDRYAVVYATHSRFLHLAGTLDDLSGRQIPPSILVYLETYDSGDFLPTPISSRPGSGGADRLVRFFAQELIPFIDAQYRTQPFRIFHSGSWGGVFCLYALFSRPDVFQGCIASTPWVIYDGNARTFVDSATVLLRERSFQHNFLYLALGNDPDPGLRERIEALVSTVRTEHPEGLAFAYHYLPDEDHSSIGHKTFFDGLRWVFADWTRIPDEALDQGIAGVRAYRESLNGRFGYDIGVHWGATYARGFALLQAGDPSGAQEMFQICTDLAPTVPACATGLGRAYEAAGNRVEARQAFQRALELALDRGEPDLDRFRDDLERVGGGGP